MNRPEPTIRVAVDPTNPGQFFACCGLLELADRLWPGAEGWFEDDGREFCIYGEGRATDSLLGLLDALITCPAFTRLEQDTSTNAAGTNEPADDESEEEEARGKKPKADPVLLGAPLSLTLDWWLRFDGSENLFKTWAANATSQQMFRKWQGPLRALREEIANQPHKLLEKCTKMQGSYGFDSLLGWDAYDVGFSLNEHNSLKKLPTRPAVELLGALGLQSFRPVLNERKRQVTYSTWAVPLLPNVARAVASGAISVPGSRRYRAEFVSRGKFKGLAFASPILRGESDE